MKKIIKYITLIYLIINLFCISAIAQDIPSNIKDELAGYESKIIQYNIWFALGIKAVFLVAAILGVATMWMAVFADMGASLIVTLNGMRLLRAPKN